MILLTVTLTSPFGAAEATAIDAGPPLEVTMTVKVEDAREAVLVRMVSVAGELDPVAMVPREDGAWGVTLRLTEREDVLVAFEAIPAEGESAISESHRLSELGVDPAIFAIEATSSTAPSEDAAPVGVGWLIAAVAAAVVAVGLVAWWAAPRRMPAASAPLDIAGEGPISSGDPDHSVEPDHSSDDQPPRSET
jgi:hypothetical protein